MRRILLYLSIILLGVCATAAAGWCAEIVEVKILLNGDPVQDVSGYGVTVHATPFTPGDLVDVKVTVRGKDEKTYVGATIVDSYGNELDFRAWSVSLSSNAFGAAETITGTLSATISGDEFVSPSSLSLVVRLWKYIVYSKYCTRTDPSDGQTPCQYCRKNGYHMEGPIGTPREKILGQYFDPR